MDRFPNVRALALSALFLARLQGSAMGALLQTPEHPAGYGAIAVATSVASSLGVSTPQPLVTLSSIDAEPVSITSSASRYVSKSSNRGTTMSILSLIFMSNIKALSAHSDGQQSAGTTTSNVDCTVSWVTYALS